MITNQYQKLSGLQKNQIDEALKKVTIEDLNSLDYGDEVLISKNVVLYHYCEDDVVVLNIQDEWIEVFQYLWDEESITLESI
jgi:hypothetical protein